jgi:tRNA U38,U39,U40 pseudouridine synthase TruA
MVTFSFPRSRQRTRRSRRSCHRHRRCCGSRYSCSDDGSLVVLSPRPPRPRSIRAVVRISIFAIIISVTMMTMTTMIASLFILPFDVSVADAFLVVRPVFLSQLRAQNAVAVCVSRRMRRRILCCRSQILLHAATTPKEQQQRLRQFERDEVGLPRQQQQQHRHQCTVCNGTFASRNSLFRHLQRGSSGACGDGSTLLSPPKRRHSIALFVGYTHWCDLRHTPPPPPPPTIDSRGSSSSSSTYEIVSSSQASVSNARRHVPATATAATTATTTGHHGGHGREDDRPAAALDVVIVNVKAPDDGTAFDAQHFATEWVHQRSNSSSDCRNGVILHGATLLDSTAHLHADADCTQHAFHYLLPVSWLPDPDRILRDFYCTDAASSASVQQQRQHRRRPTPPSLKHLKHILRQFESSTSSLDAPDSSSSSVGNNNNNGRMPSRFGLLGRKIRRPFHNYCAGGASTSRKQCLRSVDRARCLDVVQVGRQYYVLLEIKGDLFLPQQVERIVGTAVAVLHGWLPVEFIPASLNRRYILETPRAPSLGLLYRAESRYHFYEQSNGGKRLWDSVFAPPSTSSPFASVEMKEDNDEGSHPVAKLQRRLVGMADERALDQWLFELEHTVSPRIRAQLDDVTSTVSSTLSMTESSSDSENNSNVNPVYGPVLRLLQDIVDTDQWPSTSAARSSVIVMADALAAAEDASGIAKVPQAGSFTVVSDQLFDCSEIGVPLGNTLFPELTKAVFDLEQKLIDDETIECAVVTADAPESEGERRGSDVNKKQQPQRRQPSSHCAINCNAQFVPHVDSGRGLGQITSMIVGLGDYVGGALSVEGSEHPIRYRPLQFDGWRLRHWTKPFAGQRFSLVWFTPEGMQRRR